MNASRLQSAHLRKEVRPPGQRCHPSHVGPAMLVPLIVVVPPPSLSDSTLTPGAQRSTSGPRLLNEAISLAESMAETAMTFRYLAGNPTLEVAGGTRFGGQLVRPQPPAAGLVRHTTSFPRPWGRCPPKAHADHVHAILDARSMPAMIQENWPLPLRMRTLTPSSDACGATPTTFEPSMAAAIVPAQCVPWP